MDIKLLKKYMNVCKEYGFEPSFEDLNKLKTIAL